MVRGGFRLGFGRWPFLVLVALNPRGNGGNRNRGVPSLTARVKTISG